jgi:hypothetical protein
MHCARLVDRLVVGVFGGWTRNILETRPSQHTSLATLVVALYASYFSFLVFWESTIDWSLVGMLT